MATTLSNKCKYLLLKKIIDFSADTFKASLMSAGFVYNKATHQVYADVSASELATALGYTAGGATLAGVSVSQDDVLNAGKVTWSNPSWVATGGTLSAAGMIIYNDTVAAPVAKPVIGYIDFATLQSTIDGGTFTVANPTVLIED